MKKLFTVILLTLAVCGLAVAQTHPTKSPTPKQLPSNMDCEKLAEGKSVVAGSAIVKSGPSYYLCHPKQAVPETPKPETLLLRARTAAIVIHSTQTISCGDGSNGDCLREDYQTKEQIQGLISKTDLWAYFEEAPPATADVILRFVVDNRASSSAVIALEVQDSDSSARVYSETRTVTDIENDVNKLIDHLITKSGRNPIRSKEEMEKARQCSQLQRQFTSAETPYRTLKEQYNWRTAHSVSAIEAECEQHWLSNICAEAAAGTGYFRSEAWGPSTDLYNRHQAETLELLRKEESQMTDISNQYYGFGCPTTNRVYPFASN